MPDNKNLLNLDDLADVFAQLNDIEDAPEELTEEDLEEDEEEGFGLTM